MAKAAENALRHLTDMSAQAQALELEAESLKSKMGGVAKSRNETTIYAHENGRESNMVESDVGLVKDQLDVLK